MTELKFNGPATVVGFPRNEAFGFEVEPNRLVIKAGKTVFLTIEKEAAPAVQEIDVKPVQVIYENNVLPPTAQPQNNAVLTYDVPEAAAPESTEKKDRKPRGPNVTIDEQSIILIDPARANPYSKLRGKYYETLKTAHGRTVAWWKETSMVKSLEGQPITLLKFFLSENVVKLAPPDSVQQGGPVAPIQPSQTVAGATWTPPSGPITPSGNGPTFM